MDNSERSTRFADGEATRDETSIAGLIRQLRDETTQLLRQEVTLVKTEMSEKGTRIGRNTACLAAGGLVAYAGALLLLAALSVLIAWLLTLADVNPWIAGWVGPLIVGVIVAVIGYSLVQKAIATLKNESPVPEKSIESFSKGPIADRSSMPAPVSRTIRHSWPRQRVTTKVTTTKAKRQKVKDSPRAWPAKRAS